MNEDIIMHHINKLLTDIRTMKGNLAFLTQDELDEDLLYYVSNLESSINFYIDDTLVQSGMDSKFKVVNIRYLRTSHHLKKYFLPPADRCVIL